eukprot:4312050-Alexandrium_andersonii.AAC.1
MSASLVGSEMCIRDRDPIRMLAGYGSEEEYEVASGLVRSALVDRVVEPVSYTHLTLPTICSV